MTDGSVPLRHFRFTFMLCVVIEIAALSSCRKESPSAKAVVQPQASETRTVRQDTSQMDARSCRRFVQSFYDWYETPVRSANSQSDHDLYDDDVLTLKPDVLDKGLYVLLKADRDCIKRSKGICNLDFDPFYNSQDPSEKYLVKEVHLSGNRCTAQMMEINHGELQKAVRVQPVLEWQGGHWVFVNFDYFYPDDPEIKPFDLRSYLTTEVKEFKSDGEIR